MMSMGTLEVFKGSERILLHSNAQLRREWGSEDGRESQRAGFDGVGSGIPWHKLFFSCTFSCAKQRQALQMSMVDLEGKEGYRPSTEYVEDSNETLINLTDSTELLFLKLPSSNDFLSDIHGQKLFLTLHNDGKLASFKDSSGKVYDFVSYSAQEPDETVFVSSTEPKIDLASSVMHKRAVVVGSEDVREGWQCRFVTEEDEVARFDAATAGG
ncbi:hypothetical protein JHK82_036595 [Glycine max]|nr:hypothetical protein JHK82_036595 [Glycine max]